MFFTVISIAIIIIFLIIYIPAIISPLSPEEYLIPYDWEFRSYTSMLSEEFGPAGRLVKSCISFFATLLFLLVLVIIGDHFNLEQNGLYLFISVIGMLLLLYRTVKLLFIGFISLLVPFRSIAGFKSLINYNRYKFYPYAIKLRGGKK